MQASSLTSRLFVLVGAASALVMLSGNPAGAASPINFDNRGTTVAGSTNGVLASSQLINVAANCVASRAAAPSLALLLKSAQYRGLSITTNECYRPLSGQVTQSQLASSRGNSACAATPARSSTGAVVGTSIHGWGKAVDFGLNGGFGSVNYNYLKQVAGAYGWNHPGFAEPGGSPCPEPWHWEWVGDGGTLGADSVRADVIGLVPSAGDAGYAVVTGLGGTQRFGAAVDYGSATDIPLSWVMSGAAATADRKGYWMLGADGGVFSFGDAAFYGSTGAMRLNKPIVAMAPTPTGKGYWLVASDGGVFSFGDATYHGSTGAMRINRPVVGMSSTPSGNGYWLVASDGGIFSFGDAQFHGSTGAMKLNQPIVGMASSAGGYRLVASDGGIFSFGDAPFYGSAGANPPAQPVVAITPTTTGAGYWMTVANGTVVGYGDAKTFG